MTKAPGLDNEIVETELDLTYPTRFVLGVWHPSIWVVVAALAAHECKTSQSRARGGASGSCLVALLKPMPAFCWMLCGVTTRTSFVPTNSMKHGACTRLSLSRSAYRAAVVANVAG